MSYTLTLFDWSLYTLPSGLSQTDIETDSHANDPASPTYDSGSPSWIGETFTFNGGTSTEIVVNDDDTSFQDGYVETGSSQTLAEDVTIDGVTYTAGSVVQNEFAMVDASGNEVWVLRIGSTNVGFIYKVGEEPTAGETFTAANGRDGDPAESGDGQTSSVDYSEVDPRDGTVTGSAGSDLIDASYTGDPEGDQIDDGWAGGLGTNDNFVDALDGNDTVDAGAGADTIDGGTGDDSLIGGDGDDSLLGGAGNDTLRGEAGNDTLVGGDGVRDILIGGAGDDLIDGGAGQDAVIVYQNDGVDTIDAGGTADDSIGDYLELRSTSTDGVTVTFGTVDGSGTYSYLGAGTASGTFTNFEQVFTTNNDDVIDRTATTSGEQYVNARSGNDTMLGGDAVDVFEGADGNDSIDGGGGDDRLYGGIGADTISGGDGDDYIEGGDGDDLLTTGLGQDTLIGGAGNDTLMNAAGDDSLVGGDGDDSIVATDGNDTLEGGAGNDTLLGGADNDSLVGGDGNDSLLGEAGDDFLDGGSGDDTLLGGDGNDTLVAGNNTGAGDSLFGGAGDDVLTDSFWNATLQGGDGADLINVGYGTATVDGGSGGVDFDTLSFSVADDTATIVFTGDEAGTYNDDDGDSGTFTEIEALVLTTGTDSVDASADASGLSITAGDGADTITGGAGADTILGGAGDDSLAGGAGADSIEAGIGNDAIRGGAGADTIFAGDGADTVRGGDDNDAIYGGAGADGIDGGAGDDALLGEAGNDTLFGNLGNDALFGGEGDDTVSGGAGADTIYAGLGSDSITGGDDSDQIVLLDGFDNDTIEGGEGGTDIDYLDFRNLTTAVDLTFAGAETGAGISGADGLKFSEIENFLLTNQNDTVDGSANTAYMGVAAGQGDDSVVAGSGDDLLAGEDGADTLTGGSGNDTLDGGAGNDQLTGGAGDDQMTGGDGNDVFVIADGAAFFANNGNDTITDFNTGNTGPLGDGDSTNNDFIDLSGFYDSLDELRADQADDGILNQSNAFDDEGNAVDYSDNVQFGAGSLTMQGATASSYSYDNTGIVCFTAGTRILTPHGEVPIETLQIGDLVCTLNGEARPVAWIARRAVSEDELRAQPGLRPVLIRKGVLGATRDLLVSRQHGVLIGLGHLVRAAHLAEFLPGARIAQGKRQVTYVHLMLESHQILFAEGVPSESFFPGPMALRMLAPEARAALDARFPELGAIDTLAMAEQCYGPLARPFARRKDVPALLRASLQASQAGALRTSLPGVPNAARRSADRDAGPAQMRASR